MRILLIYIPIFCLFACKHADKPQNFPLKKDVAYKEYDTSIYIGHVTGKVSDSLEQNEFLSQRDSLYKLQNLKSSSYKIEIRFFTINYWSDTSYCIILKYDTGFTINALKHYYKYDTTDRTNWKRSESVLISIPCNRSADSIFEQLVINGIFSLNTTLAKVNFSEYPLLELTKNGFIEGSTIGDVMDGSAYTLEYKVDKYYDRIDMNNPAVYFSHNPDVQLYRRKYEVTKIMLSGLK